MPGTLLISLDCEGKWGLADKPSMLESDLITDEGLRWAYSQLFSLLEENDLRATFAVVGLFVAGQESARAHLREMVSSPGSREWMKLPMKALQSKATDGWFYEELPRFVEQSGNHELASHGYSHTPFLSTGFTEDSAHYELSAMQRLSTERSWGIQSMVFPRNQVAFVHLLGQYGIRMYRSSFDGDGLTYRIGTLFSEFNIRARSEALPSRQVVPAGRFVNWRSGARRAIPPSVTTLRWKRILRHAAKTGQCAHLWFHPHNLITGKHQIALVSQILRMAGDHVRRGDLQSLQFRELL
jgi:hypothetical protein